MITNHEILLAASCVAETDHPHNRQAVHDFTEATLKAACNSGVDPTEAMNVASLLVACNQGDARLVTQLRTDPWLAGAVGNELSRLLTRN